MTIAAPATRAHVPVLDYLSPGARPKTGRGDVLSLGFAATIGMWAVGYFCRMPATNVPGPVTVSLMALALLLAGFFAGRLTLRGILGGFCVGITAGFLNLLVLGSLLTQGQSKDILHAAATWLPGFLLATGLVGAIGAAVGKAFPSRRTTPVNWTFAFSCVTVAATLLLITAGGMVTGLKAGMAVPDWPSSFGSNMFLFPLSRMTGGIYYEHTHRLIGSLVGFSVLVQAIRFLKVERRTWVKILGFVAGLLVLTQAILGGKRVVDNSLPLAMSHGTLAQLVLATLCVIAAATSTPWAFGKEPTPRDGASADYFFTPILVALVFVQLVMGVFVRHTGLGILGHVSMAVLVLLLVFTCGVRAWGLNPGQPILQRLGLAMLGIVVLQMLLGILALVVLHGAQPAETPTILQAAVTTAHQVNGALLLTTSALLAAWTRRLLSPTP